MDRDQPIIYVTLGSSGALGCWPLLRDTLSGMRVTAVIASAGRELKGPIPENCRMADYLPGGDVLLRAKGCIFNGGAATGYQALSRGVSVLALPSNADQFFFSESVKTAGAGILERPSCTSPSRMEQAVRTLVEDRELSAGAEELQKSIHAMSTEERFRLFLDNAVVREKHCRILSA